MTGTTSPYAIGLVLSGGGSFGAWEIGALQALWDIWDQKHPGEAPPIRVVAGTSTGAVIAPFALLEHTYLRQVDDWYQKVENDDVFGLRFELGLPAAVFFLSQPSALDFGYPGPSNPARYYQNYKTALTENGLKTLEACAGAWPQNRLAVTSVDFGSGQLDIARNWPADIPMTGTPPPDPYKSRLYDGIVASAMTPMIGPPIKVRSSGSAPAKTPHFDGGVCSEMPFGALFETAAINPPIALTHVIAISCYPYFPGADHPTKPFPGSPKFLNIGLRFDTVLSEASATKDIRIARAALELLRQNVAPATVAALTGLSIAGPPPILIEAVPGRRLGWDNGQFLHPDMKTMRDQGHSEATTIFQTALP